MTFDRRVLLMALVIAASAATSVAADHSGFNGSWKANLQKSDFGGQPAPDQWIRTLTIQNGKITLASIQARDGQELKSEFTLPTDGKQISMQMGGGDAKGTAVWEGDTLVIKTQRDSMNGEIVQNERATLAADGKAITFDVAIQVGGNDLKMKMIFEKK
ncbi:MAG: hypothetical protein ABI823_05690 [Bryobacteraceae bacterium]